MARLNTGGTTRVAPKSPFTTTGPATTFENGKAYKHSDKTDLFFTAVTHFYGEDTFYENAATRNARFVELIRSVTRNDPTWVRNFIHWLRHDGNMRTGALVGAVEYAQAGGPSPRSVINDVCVRADEPAEVLAYIKANNYRFSGGVQRGVADAAIRLYNEFNSLKYDSAQKSFRFGDVVELSHPKAKALWQSDLFKWLIDSRHNRGSVPESLQMLTRRAELNAMFNTDATQTTKLVLKRPELLSEAGMTWEAISTYGAMDASKWEAVIPQMGYMALIRNLRNFEQAGISVAVQKAVAAKISDPEAVAKSRQLPFRFFSAYSNTNNDRFRSALADALDLSLVNIPVLPGSTMVTIDTSASMTSMGYSAKSKVMPVYAAALFGLALAKVQNNVDVRIFASTEAQYKMTKGKSVLRELEDFAKTQIGRAGHGTNIPYAVRHGYRGQDRIFIMTDMQTTGYNVDAGIPATTRIYGFNLGGYGNTALDLTKKNRYEFGGLTDATFKMIPLLEAGNSAKWPWE